jgi:RNA polymerase sigma-70 factor (ECF subfamily)
MQEVELVKKCIKKDRLAQRQLYEEYGPKLMHLCHRYMQNTQEAEEVFHDSMMKVYQKIGDFKFKSSLGTWIYKIGMFTSLDRLRKNKSMLQVSYVSELPDETVNEDFEFDAIPKEEQVMTWISKLTPNKQVIVNMHVFENLKHDKIAEILGVSHNAVRSTYSRARKELIEMYKLEEKGHVGAK